MPTERNSVGLEIDPTMDLDFVSAVLRWVCVDPTAGPSLEPHSGGRRNSEEGIPCVTSPLTRLDLPHSTPNRHTGGELGRNMRSGEIRPIQKGVDEPIPLEEEQEQRLSTSREGRRNGSPSGGEDGVGGCR